MVIWQCQVKPVQKSPQGTCKSGLFEVIDGSCNLEVKFGLVYIAVPS